MYKPTLNKLSHVLKKLWPPFPDGADKARKHWSNNICEMNTFFWSSLVAASLSVEDVRIPVIKVGALWQQGTVLGLRVIVPPVADRVVPTVLHTLVLGRRGLQIKNPKINLVQGYYTGLQIKDQKINFVCLLKYEADFLNSQKFSDPEVVFLH